MKPTQTDRLTYLSHQSATRLWPPASLYLLRPCSRATAHWRAANAGARGRLTAATIGRKMLRAVAILLLSGALGAAQAQPGPPAGMPPMPSVADTDYSAAIRIENGVYAAGKSVAEAVTGGSSGDTFATGINISSKAADFNGVLVTGGKSAYRLSDSTIDLSGNGSNDFLGLGAGAMAVEGMLVLDGVRITTKGVISSATIATDRSVLKVYDSTLIANGGPLPDGYVPKIGPGMMEPPAPLGISGTARTHITMRNARSYFYNTSIIAHGWGALSTDAAGGEAYLEANHCDIRVYNSGYGTYADFGAQVVINDSTMQSATFGGIIAGAAKLAFNGGKTRAGVNGVMIHSVMGNPLEVGKLDIRGGAMMAGDAVILIKSANADILVEAAVLRSDGGILIRSKKNEDPNATPVGDAKAPGIKVALQNLMLEGDILHEDPERTMTVALTDTRLTGAINRAAISLKGDSHWIATADSGVMLPGGIDLARIDAHRGVTITAIVDRPGNLRGDHKLASGGLLKIKSS